jgi:hypothetical protein
VTDVSKKALETRISLHRSPVRELLYLGQLEAGKKRLETEHLYGSSVRGESGGRAPLLRSLKDMQKKALEMGISLHKGTLWEPGWGGAPLLGTLTGERRLWQRSISMGALRGEPGGRSF